MLSLLLKNKLNIFLLGFTRGRPGKRAGRIIGTAIGIIIFSLVLFYSAKLINFVYDKLDIILADTILNIALDYAFGIIFIFILFTGIATTLYILYLSEDMELLLSLPISYRTVFTYKYIEAVTANSYLFLIAGFPFLIAYGITSEFPFFYYPALLIIYISVISLPTSFGVLIGMIIARYISPSRAKEIIAIVGGLLGVIIWLSSQIMPRYVENLAPELRLMGVEDIQQYIIALFDKPFLKVLPSTWGSNALFYIHNGNYGQFALNFISITAVSGLLMFLCIALSKKIYYTGWSGASQVTGGTITGKKRGKKVEIASSRKQGFSFFSGANYLIIKDFKVLIRDTHRVIRVMMPVVMFIFIFFWSFSSQVDAGEINFFIKIETMIVLLFPMLVSGFVNVNLSGSNIGGEGLKFWILKTSPVPAKRILRTKIIFSSCITALLGCIIMIIFYLLYKPGILTLIGGLILMVLFSWGDSLICTSVGTFFPVFKPSQSNKNSVSFIGGLLILIFFILYVAFFGGVITGSLILANFLGWTELTAFLIILVIEILVNILLHNILINISAHRLNSIEWKY